MRHLCRVWRRRRALLLCSSAQQLSHSLLGAAAMSNRPHTVVLDHTLLTTHKRSSAWIHLGIVCSYEHIIPNSIYNSFYLGTFPPLSHVGCWPSRLAWRCVPVTCEMTRGRAISVHQSRRYSWRNRHPSSCRLQRHHAPVHCTPLTGGNRLVTRLDSSRLVST